MWLFRQFILRFLLRERVRASVTVFGISLGIAVVIAIQLSNASAVRGFAAAIEAVSGKSSLEIVGSALGIDETRILELDWLRQYGPISPIIEGEGLASFSPDRTEWLHILGVDILKDRSFRDYQLLEFESQNRIPTAREFLSLLLDPQSIILTRKFADRHGLQVGARLKMITGDRVRIYVVRGLLLDEGPARTLEGNFALMDIAAAQLALGRLGRLDRLELQVSATDSLEAVEQSIASRLPADLAVERPSRRGRQVEKMLEAFHFNLSALSHISLLVGLFLIYSTISVSVVARRQEIGLLRAMGVRRGTILRLFLAEAAGLSLLGCSLGILLGRLLAYGAVRITSTTVSALYIASASRPVPLGLDQVLMAFVIGVPLSLLAAAIPALEAAKLAPTAAIHEPGHSGGRYQWHIRMMTVPLSLLFLAWWFCRLDPVTGRPFFGYLAAISIVFGAASLVPGLLLGLSRWTGRLLNSFFHVEGWLANANLSGAIKRISISVAALAVSLSMMVAIAIMVHSFRETVKYWVSQTLHADLYVRPATRINVSTQAALSQTVEEMIRNLPSVAAVDRFLNFDILYEGNLVTLGTGEFEILLRHGGLLFKAPHDGREAMRSAIGKEAVVVSESFALKYRKRVGDTVVLPTLRGRVGFQIAAVYFDYSNDRGVVVMDHQTFLRFFQE
ncbi:MAG TPA: ABC transporter permease, partial [Terriglobia bacterium]|nr:ABC transporter permease [Terriglobia bacterium]